MITLEDNILLLLDAQKDYPIYTMDMLIAQILLSQKRFFTESEKPFFYVRAGRLYSPTVSKAMDNLDWTRLVDARGRSNTLYQQFRITPFGHKYVTCFVNLPLETQRRLESLRIGWDELGNEGIHNLLRVTGLSK